ncbi:SDR family NAD(P)-dependent oxidoreductase [Parafrankia sp. EUN1f]|uniref:SDR family NAD(P)-dependent oxidoreductase n=1 Tax=Parafrankia sp. EUN1f TaxID=102897 RepID=UPI0001C467C0|nr:SDR family NAD(P)-dependent oxidoreductase [Parafrankia sp. EUN1f]EFC81124.1 short-chain dehydrogenase/reductase SDR [Parafrankia sp. EUN1f]
MTDRITTPFNAESTAAEVIAGIDLTGRRAIVTGGASGIGVETARALALAGAEVTLAVRDLAAGERTAADITGTGASAGASSSAGEGAGSGTAAGRVLVEVLDLADQASVAAFVRRWDGPLDILVNNAGVMASPLTRTPEGWELQFATNHLGHFALTVGLHDALAAAAVAAGGGGSAGGGARVVSVSSSAHHRSPVVFDDIHFDRRPYDPWGAYGQSKTANVLFAVEASRRWADDGITVNALMPGGIRTNLQRYVSDEELARLRAAAGSADLKWKTPEQGAATSVLVATSPLLAGIGGRYFEDCNEAQVGILGARNGVAAYALDPDAAARLWDVSEHTLGLGVATAS